MGAVQLQLHCANCNALMPHTKKTPNHVLHLLLTLFTAGLWLVVWILIALSASGAGEARCGKCGTVRAAK